MNIRAQNDYEKEFLSVIQSMTGSYQRWQVWSDVISIMAATISNAVDRTPGRWNKREQEYLRLIKKHDSDKVAQLFAITVNALESNPDQDFLGSLYMRMDLGSHWHGQFFTPYDVCRMSACMTLDASKVQERGYISLCDPAIGGGAMLIAAANELKRMGVNYQTQAYFVGQDIDRVAGQMAYIQMSLLGMPGYIAIANTLTDPIVGDALEPIEKDTQEFWYTPFWFTDVWTMRRICRRMDNFTRRDAPIEIEPPKKYTFFFNFEEGESNVRTEQAEARS